jgi:hypothetical protein
MVLLSASLSFAYANQSVGGAESNLNQKGDVLIKEDTRVGDIIHQGILEDKELLSFLQEIKASIKNHNWSAFIGMCSSQHYKAQVGDTRMSTTQYIAEAIGVHNQGNNIFEAGENKVDMKVLEKIQDLKFFSIKKHYNEIKINGEILLKSGKKLKVEIIALYDTQDGYIITGALG